MPQNRPKLPAISFCAGFFSAFFCVCVWRFSVLFFFFRRARQNSFPLDFPIMPKNRTRVKAQTEPYYPGVPETPGAVFSFLRPSRKTAAKSTAAETEAAGKNTRGGSPKNQNADSTELHASAANGGARTAGKTGKLQSGPERKNAARHKNTARTANSVWKKQKKASRGWKRTNRLNGS